MGILRKLGATLTAAAFVGVGALSATTSAEAAVVAPTAAPLVAVSAQKSATVAKSTAVVGKYRLDKRCLTKGRVLCINKKTRKLVYVVNRKSKNHVSSLYKSKMPYAMFFSGGQAVHYSSDFKARGYNGASHGCVNIRDKTKIAWIFARIKIGDKVVVYNG